MLFLFLIVFWHYRALNLTDFFKSWHEKDKEKILRDALVLFSLSFQIRPEISPPDELDEDEDEEGDEKDVDLSIPGPCYLKLLPLTSPLVLPGDLFT